MSYVSEAAAIAERLVSVRRELHRHPEIGLELPRTQATLLRELAPLGLEIQPGKGSDSIVAVLRGGAMPQDVPHRPTVLLRGDMDALPILEQNDLDYRSTVDGTMHACGHDLHATMLLGSVFLLSAHKDELAGDVVFMFQPGEEGWDGAQVMIDEGVLEASGRLADAAFALHVSGGRQPRGVVTTIPGPVLAATADLHVTVLGRGGHGSRPHTALDPIPVACEIVIALQTMLGRGIDAQSPAVVTVGSFHAGSAANVIPDTAEFEATIRVFSDDLLDELETRINRLCEGIAAAYGLEVDVRFSKGYPALVNDADRVEFASGVVAELFGEDAIQGMRPGAAAEDFARVLQQVPGAMLFIGACYEGLDWQSAPDNHTATVRYSESVLPQGAALLAELAARQLTTLSGSLNQKR